MQLRTGWSGLTDDDPEAARLRTARFCQLGLLSALLVASAWTVATAPEVGLSFAAASGALIGLLLAQWPLALRRFFQDRCFALYVAGDDAEPPRPAPDGGITALGWLLLASAAVELAGGLAGALSAPLIAVDVDQVRALGGDAAVLAIDRSPWWGVAVSVLALWAALHLVRVTPRRRIAALIYGVAALLNAGLLDVPLARALGHCTTIAEGPGAGTAVYGALLGQTVLDVVLALAAMILTHRAGDPDAVVVRWHGRRTARPS
jgi:hypothetical protein